MSILAVLMALLLLVLGRVVLDIACKEIQGRLDDLPVLLLRLARRRLPDDLRVPMHDEAWLPELLHIQKQYELQPATRLTVTTRFAFGLCVAAKRTARAAGMTLSWRDAVHNKARLVPAAFRLISATYWRVFPAVPFCGHLSFIAALFIVFSGPLTVWMAAHWIFNVAAGPPPIALVLTLLVGLLALALLHSANRIWRQIQAEEQQVTVASTTAQTTHGGLSTTGEFSRR